MAAGVYYDEKTDRFVHVAKCSDGNYSFYRTKDLHKPGARIQGLSKNNDQRWFDTEEEATQALPEFAKLRGFVFLTYNEILELERSRLISTAYIPWWPR